ncbi:MAG: hypothetical protein H6571_21885 [Lewinellaceae bacterium]|jgi:hypothetical protein|nr:hypothetical protein [Lewinellaceae bacterium]
MNTKLKKIRKLRISLVAVFVSIFPIVSHAHCPLCTAGAGVLAVIAVSLGVPGIIIASLLGGFALALGLWMKNVIKKKYFPHQDLVVTWLIYLSTVIPLWPILKDFKALYIPFLGIDKYAETIPVDLFIVGVVVGAIVLIVSPYISRKVTMLAKKQIIPFQGIIITIILLVVIPLLIDLFLLTS